MSDFSCPVVTIKVSDHPNADRLEIARVGGYESVVLKGQYADGDKAVYLPEASLLPYSLIEELGLSGRLAGPDSNRVKAVRLRGVLSQGLLVPLDSPHLAGVRSCKVGDDLRAHLGIVKYVPPIPVHMEGIVEPAPSAAFDVDSWQAHLGTFADGEPVQVTEKLHGTFCEMGFDLEIGPFVASKGMAGKTRFVLDEPRNDSNLYVRTWRQIGSEVEALARSEGRSVTLCGEIVGPKVQDLQYGLSEPTFFVFDSLIGPASEYRWLSPEDTVEIAEVLDVAHVPVLHDRWPFDQAQVMELAGEPSALGGGLREGVVVRPVEVRHERDIGRVMLKYVNPAYLTRRGGTDYN